MAAACAPSQRSDAEAEYYAYRLAYCYVQDALAGRLRNGLASVQYRSIRVQRAFALQSSAAFEFGVCLASLVHMQLGWFEPAHSLGGTFGSAYRDAAPGGAAAVEALCVFVMCADVALKASMSRRPGL